VCVWGRGGGEGVICIIYALLLFKTQLLFFIFILKKKDSNITRLEAIETHVLHFLIPYLQFLKQPKPLYTSFIDF